MAEAVEILGLDPPSATPGRLAEPAQDAPRRGADAPGDVDALARALRRSAADVATGLVELELAGLVINVEGVYRVAA